MTTPDQPRADYWTNGTDFSALLDERFEGAQGLERLSGAMRLSADPPAAFRARLSRIQLDHVALQSLRATAHRTDRTIADIAAVPTPIVSVGLVLDGRLIVHADETFEVGPGQVLITDSDTPLTVIAPAPVHHLHSVVGTEHLSPSLQAGRTSFARALPRTRLSDSFFRLIARTLSPGEPVSPIGSAALLRALLDLHVAVLAEAQSSADGHPPTLRERIDAHIDAHLRDPALTPSTIADALGVSVRGAHAAFSDGGHTIAREIRERRLEAVAFELSTSSHRRDLDALAADHGFSGPDVLGRLFRLRFGTTVRDFHAGRRDA